MIRRVGALTGTQQHDNRHEATARLRGDDLNDNTWSHGVEYYSANYCWDKELECLSQLADDLRRMLFPPGKHLIGTFPEPDELCLPMIQAFENEIATYRQ